MEDGMKRKIQMQLEITKNCFDARSSNGRIQMDEIFNVSASAIEKLEIAGVLSKEELDGLKTFQDDLKDAVGSYEKFDLNKDGFIDWNEFMALMMQARSNYYKMLFKKFDLNQDDQIDKAEMDLIVQKLKEKGETERSDQLKDLFHNMLKNFDEDNDGKINVNEFVNAIKNLKDSNNLMIKDL